jgi:hypothetical protein
VRPAALLVERLGLVRRGINGVHPINIGQGPPPGSGCAW